MKTKDKILLCAKNHLLAKGQKNFTVRSITAESGVNPGLVHHYFGSKEKLILAMIDFVFTEPLQILSQSMRSEDLSRNKEYMVHFIINNSDIFSLLLELVYFTNGSLIIRKKVRFILKQLIKLTATALGVKEKKKSQLVSASIIGVILLFQIDNQFDKEALIQAVISNWTANWGSDRARHRLNRDESSENQSFWGLK